MLLSELELLLLLSELELLLLLSELEMLLSELLVLSELPDHDEALNMDMG